MVGFRTSQRSAMTCMIPLPGGCRAGCFHWSHDGRRDFAGLDAAAKAAVKPSRKNDGKDPDIRGHVMIGLIHEGKKSRWWFQIFFIFTPIWGR